MLANIGALLAEREQLGAKIRVRISLAPQDAWAKFL